MNYSYLKRRYSDMKYAIGVIAPIIAYSNFILIAYNFTDLKNIIPFYIFAPLFSIGLVIMLTLIGKVFRKKQLATDITLIYEQSVESARTARVSMEFAVLLGKKLGLEPTQEYLDRIEYHRQIERGEK